MPTNTAVPAAVVCPRCGERAGFIDERTNIGRLQGFRCPSGHETADAPSLVEDAGLFLAWRMEGMRRICGDCGGSGKGAPGYEFDPECHGRGWLPRIGDEGFPTLVTEMMKTHHLAMMFQGGDGRVAVRWEPYNIDCKTNLTGFVLFFSALTDPIAAAYVAAARAMGWWG